MYSIRADDVKNDPCIVQEGCPSFVCTHMHVQIGSWRLRPSPRTTSAALVRVLKEHVEIVLTRNKDVHNCPLLLQEHEHSPGILLIAPTISGPCMPPRPPRPMMSALSDKVNNAFYSSIARKVQEGKIVQSRRVCPGAKVWCVCAALRA